MATVTKTIRSKHFATLLTILVIGGAALWWYLRPGVSMQTRDLAEESSRKSDPDTLELSPEAARLAKYETTPAREITRPRVIKLRGSLAIDPNRLIHLHPRFPGQIVELGTMTDTPGAGPGVKTISHPLTFMDHVNKDQVVGIIWSKDLGEKKSELVDALARLRLDRVTLERVEGTGNQGRDAAAIGARGGTGRRSGRNRGQQGRTHAALLGDQRCRYR